MLSLSGNILADDIEAFNSHSIYLDDLLYIDNPYFEQMVNQIYPTEDKLFWYCFVLTSWLSFVVSAVSLSLSHWYPGSGVVLDCIDSWSLHPYLLYTD